MKTFVILLSLVITLAAAEWKLKTREEAHEIIRSCDRRYNVSDELIEKASTGKYPPIEVIQVVVCGLEGFGIWSSSEGFNVDRLMIAFEHNAKEKNLDREEFRKNLESCLDNNTQGSSSLEWAYRNFKCFFDNKNFWSLLREVKFFKQGDEQKE